MSNLVNISITPVDPANLIVSVEDAKGHCNCDTDTWDNHFPRWIKAATQALESYSGYVFTPSDVVAEYTQNHGGRIELLFNNGMVYDGDYTINGSFMFTDDNHVTLSYKAGVTEDWMKQAVLMYVADLYVNRGDVRQVGDTTFPSFVGKEAKDVCKVAYSFF